MIISAEMDVWEANSVSTALTPHSCQPEGYSVCEDDTCGGTYSLDRYAGTCDANGCDCMSPPSSFTTLAFQHAN